MKHLIIGFILITTVNCFSAETPERLIAESSTVMQIASDYLTQQNNDERVKSIKKSIEIVRDLNPSVSFFYKNAAEPIRSQPVSRIKSIYEVIQGLIEQINLQTAKIDGFMLASMNQSEYEAFSAAAKKYYSESAQYRKALQAEMEKIGNPSGGKPDEGSPSKATFSGSDGGGNADDSRPNANARRR